MANLVDILSGRAYAQEQEQGEVKQKHRGESSASLPLVAAVPATAPSPPPSAPQHPTATVITSKRRRRRLVPPSALLLACLPSILAYLPLPTLHALALTSRALIMHTTPFLYTTLTHTSILPPLRQSLLETLAARPDLAACVRSFTWSARVASSTALGLLGRALKGMKGLERLWIEVRARDAGVLWCVGASEGEGGGLMGDGGKEVAGTLKSVRVEGCVTCEAAGVLGGWLEGRKGLRRLELPDVYWLGVPGENGTESSEREASNRFLSPASPVSPVGSSPTMPRSPTPSSFSTSVTTITHPDASLPLPSLPNLVHFTGTPALAALLAPGRPMLRSVRLEVCTTLYDGLRPGVVVGELAKAGRGSHVEYSGMSGANAKMDRTGIEELWLEMTEKVCGESRTVRRLLGAVGARLEGMRTLGVGWRGKRREVSFVLSFPFLGS
jgi:hypothetical protein